MAERILVALKRNNPIEGDHPNPLTSSGNSTSADDKGEKR